MIDSLRLYRLTIPFKLVFKHHSAERGETETVWVEADGDGVQGAGEGCPRMYVTRESPESAKEFFDKHCASIRREVRSMEDLKRWIAEHEISIGQNAAAWCAIELAILDLLAGRRGVPVETVLALEPPIESFRYSAVIGDGSTEQFQTLASRYAEMGFTDFKIKLSGEPARDREKIEILSNQAIPGLRVRADANNLWPDAQTAIEHLHELGGRFAGIEEPVAAGEFDAMRHIGKETDCPIILDESLLNPGQVSLLAGDPERWIINVRVSKMGGLLRSLDVVTRARRVGIPITVGAHVGETSLLTRAGMVVAQAAGDALFAQEGAFGTLLLESDVVSPPLMFGQAGVQDVGSRKFAEKPGWGLTLEPPEGSLRTLSEL